MFCTAAVGFHRTVKLFFASSSKKYILRLLVKQVNCKYEGFIVLANCANRVNHPTFRNQEKTVQYNHILSLPSEILNTCKLFAIISERTSIFFAPTTRKFQFMLYSLQNNFCSNLRNEI